MEHYDGNAWTVVPSPPLGPSDQPHMGRGIDDLTAISAKSVWALGHAVPAIRGESVSRDVFERWNGTRWQVVRSPRPSSKSGTSAVEAIATDRTGEVWAVGGRVR